MGMEIGKKVKSKYTLFIEMNNWLKYIQRFAMIHTKIL